MTGTSVASANLTAESITVRGPRRLILSDVSCSAGPGEVLAVTGRSGSGKTTLLAVLAGLLAPAAGSVRFAGTTVVPGDTEHLLRTGVVLQLYGLVSVLTAQENVEVALQARGIGGRKVRSQAARALERIGLTDLSDRLVEQLSGGQRQRVAVARALVTTPTLILADEPSAELDAVNRDRVIAELRAEADRGAVVVVATHDPDVAARCDDELHLADGVVAEPT
ncbi:MAG TPA: ATP-binding cassette domain-containing protein [Jiangellaceae bacterium]|nr:ATP-binding cassette domain-containing protein [Jiangellaceae bacterium]